jgi:predicted nuclease with TOPRIM domain
MDDEDDLPIRALPLDSKKPLLSKQDTKGDVLPYMSGIFDIDQIIANQIVAAKVAEMALKDLQADAEVKMSDIQGVLDEASALQDNMAAVLADKQEVTARLNSVQGENDQIKIKFAKLLDQFQEYVNDNEVRMQEEELKLRQGQDMVLSELHSTIKELE